METQIFTDALLFTDQGRVYLCFICLNKIIDHNVWPKTIQRQSVANLQIKSSRHLLCAQHFTCLRYKKPLFIWSLDSCKYVTANFIQNVYYEHLIGVTWNHIVEVNPIPGVGKFYLTHLTLPKLCEAEMLHGS